MKFIWPWMLAVMSGVLMAFSFAPFNMEWLCWIALAPLICGAWFGASWRTGDWIRLLALGYVCGLAFFGITLFWLSEVTWPGWILVGFYLAIYPSLWTLYLGKAGLPADRFPRDTSRFPIPAFLSSGENLALAGLSAAAWTGTEWLRGVIFSGFGWNPLGVALHRQIALIQIADITGAGGPSFLIVMANVMAVMTVKRLLAEIGRMRIRPHYDFLATVALVAFVFAYGARRIAGKEPPSFDLKIAAVQGNIPQVHKMDPAFESRIMDTYRRLTGMAIALQPDLIVWPEAATPRAAFNYEDMATEVMAIYREHGKDFLLGTVHYDQTGDYNSAALLTARAGLQIYNKNHLVPFGEFVPFRQGFPLFAWVIGDLVPDDFDAGAEPAVLILGTHNIRAAPLICFEDTLGDLARQFLLRGAQIFVNVTNDSWFQKSAGSRQHQANAVFRCAETHIPMVRAANTGVTCFIDRLGRVTNELRGPGGETFVEGVLFGTVRVPKATPRTFYSANGDLFSIVCLLAALVSLKAALWRTARRETADGG